MTRAYVEYTHVFKHCVGIKCECCKIKNYSNQNFSSNKKVSNDKVHRRRIKNRVQNMKFHLKELISRLFCVY